MNITDAEPIHIHRLPFYVTAYKLPDKTFALWDGERHVVFHRRSEWREAFRMLERARIEAIPKPQPNPHLAALGAHS